VKLQVFKWGYGEKSSFFHNIIHSYVEKPIGVTVDSAATSALVLGKSSFSTFPIRKCLWELRVYP
jgi:hypothetical protein